MLKESIDYIKILIKFKLKIANWRKTIMEDRLKRNLYWVDAKIYLDYQSGDVL